METVSAAVTETPADPQKPASDVLAPPDEVAKVLARINELIPQLGDDQLKLREEAADELREIGGLARSALQAALKSDNEHIASRAELLLAEILPLTHTVVDAVNQPIPYALVIIRMSARPRPGEEPTADGGEPFVFEDWADAHGRISIPAPKDVLAPAENDPNPPSANSWFTTVEIRHPDYGRGRFKLDESRGQQQLRFPLVRVGSEWHDRAACGIVVAPDKEPVIGAILSCHSARTVGEGLINGAHPYGDVLTDEAGEFRYYLPNGDPKQERGELIPPSTRYNLLITPPEETYFPLTEDVSNVGPVRIVLPKPTQRHRFRFQLTDGKWLETPEELQNLWVQLDRRAEGRSPIGLPAASLLRGRTMLPGTYTAIWYRNGQQVNFERLEVQTDSPEELIFRLPKPVVYRGQVVQGVTNQPVDDAFVIAWNSTSRQNLALLSDEEWETLEAMESNPPADHPGLALLAKHYGVIALVRTDEQGRFEITRQPDQQFYGLLAFNRGSIPFRVRLGSLTPNAEQRVDAGVFPLFPAAKVTVRPVFEGNNLSVLPEWIIAKDAQPEWFPRFRSVQRGSDRDFDLMHWLRINESQPIYVPAGIRLQLRLESPYHDEWAPAILEEQFQLAPDDYVNAGDVRFAPSLPAVVQVVNAAGKPVEGFAVRRKYDPINAWCVAHNTDANGKAFFHVHPNSKGMFRVTDLKGPEHVTTAANLSVRFEVLDDAPQEPFRIVVTDEQVKLLPIPK